MSYSKILCIAAAVVFAGAPLILTGCSGGRDAHDTAPSKAAKYYCPMHPSYTSDRPGNCPICNMKLVPMPQELTPEAIEHALHLHAGDTAHPEASPRDAAKKVEGYATVLLDQEKRELLGIESRPVERRLIRETMRLAGTIMFDKAGMGGEAWVYVPIDRRQGARIYPNQRAEIEIPVRGRRLQGAVTIIDSDAALHTHIIKIRLTVNNPESFLKTDMGANVTLEFPERDAVTIPEKGVFYSGERSIAFADLGNGVYEPRELVLGAKSGDFYEALSGVSEGEKVVTNGGFLLDSESRIKAALRPNAAGSESGGTHVH